MKLDRRLFPEMLASSRKGCNSFVLASKNYSTGLCLLKRFNSSSNGSVSALLKKLDIDTSTVLPGVYNGQWEATGPIQTVINPSTNTPLAQVQMASVQDYESTMTKVLEANNIWKSVPAPKRGEICRDMRQALSGCKQELGHLISLEMGKIKSEGVGEVVEYLDILDYCVGLSRMFSGLVLPSERSGHVMFEQWNPIGFLYLFFNFRSNWSYKRIQLSNGCLWLELCYWFSLWKSYCLETCSNWCALFYCNN
jgi:hypothetical protein